MKLSDDVISQFVKITNDKKEDKKENTVYGTIVVQAGAKYVKLDGSDLLTPITSTMSVKDGDRVIVMIKNHSSIVTGNISSPSASDSDVKDLNDKVSKFEIIVANKIDVKDFNAEKARIDDLVAENVTIRDTLQANEAAVGNLQADNVTIKSDLAVNKASINSLLVSKLDVDAADMKYATIKNLEAANAAINNLEATYGDFEILATNKFTAISGQFTNLTSQYANIDFSNIGSAAIEKFFSKSGLIENLTVGAQTITGQLVGVTISGDLIEGNTIVADKLVVKGEDGLYYRLNTDGASIETEQTDYNSLNGSVIRAKSVTAEKISVSDLVAFDATIGGFHITDSALYSGAKDMIDNTAKGIYLDKEGQIALGDGDNYLKYYEKPDIVAPSYALEISAESFIFSNSGKNVETAVDDASKIATNYLSYGDGKLIIGDMTKNNVGRNVCIDSDSVDIRNGETVLATYGDNCICLGMDGQQAALVVGGTGLTDYMCKLYNENDSKTDDYNRLVIEAGNSITFSAPNAIYQDVYWDNGTTYTSGHINIEGVLPWDGEDGWAGSSHISSMIELDCAVGESDGGVQIGCSRIQLSGDNQGNGCIDMYASDSISLNADYGTYLYGNLVTYDHLYMQNSKFIYGASTDGVNLNMMQVSAANNLVIGYGGYVHDVGRTHIYGYDICMYVKAAGGASFYPYWTRGRSFSLHIYTGGFLTSSSTAVRFTIPLSKPYIGSGLTVTVTSYSNGGLILRQEGKYTHGSSADTFKKPSKIEAVLVGSGTAIGVTAIMSTTTNAVNNSAIGIDAYVTVTFS